MKTAAVLGIGMALALAGCGRNGGAPVPVTSPPPSTDTADLQQRIAQFCGACHDSPSADIFPRSAWKGEIERMYRFYQDSTRPWKLTPPPIDQVVRSYEERAPQELPPATIRRADRPLSLRLSRIDYPAFRGPPNVTPPQISNVHLVHLLDRQRLDVLACDMRAGAVLLLQPYLPDPHWHLLYAGDGKAGFNPAHTEVVDLDGDGILDILVANLGNMLPTDRRCGSVLWLRGQGEGRYEPITLLKGKGRIADVRAGDFNGDGKLDLIVAAFGWNTTGEIYYLQNRSPRGQKPDFAAILLDERHGALHVPVADLNGDGRLDFVALISQEHETIVAFLNEGNGQFQKKPLYRAGNPGYGSSGIELVDLNGDGKLDVLYTNGDVLDTPYLLKPYHSVQWLENKGNLEFVHHPLTPMYGAHRAVAADLDGDGDQDILAVSFLPPDRFPQRQELGLDAVIVLEQTAPGVFARHSVETATCDHVSCAVGDVFGTGRQDLVIANFVAEPDKPAVTIWKNLGARRTPKK